MSFTKFASRADNLAEFHPEFRRTEARIRKVPLASFRSVLKERDADEILRFRRLIVVIDKLGDGWCDPDRRLFPNAKRRNNVHTIINGTYRSIGAD